VRQPESREGRKADSVQRLISRKAFCAYFSKRRDAVRIRPAASSSSTKANRSQGRDAKPRAGGKAVGSLAAERVNTHNSATDEEEAFFTKAGLLKVNQAGRRRKNKTTQLPSGTQNFFSSSFLWGTKTGTEELL
jgi:hypothetical protein